MALGRKIVVVYLVVVGAAFLLGYVVLGIREQGLWLLLMAINFPSSLAVEPEMATISLALNWSLGAPMHVWTTQLACMVVNGAVLFALVSIIAKLRGARKERHAV
jgi:hypothetical protein